jgi:hypothetical protein
MGAKKMKILNFCKVAQIDTKFVSQ